MLAITGYSVSETVDVGGYWSNADGGGGTFTYTSSSAGDNGGTIFSRTMSRDIGMYLNARGDSGEPSTVLEDVAVVRTAGTAILRYQVNCVFNGKTLIYDARQHGLAGRHGSSEVSGAGFGLPSYNTEVINDITAYDVGIPGTGYGLDFSWHSKVLVKNYNVYRCERGVKFPNSLDVEFENGNFNESRLQGVKSDFDNTGLRDVSFGVVECSDNGSYGFLIDYAEGVAVTAKRLLAERNTLRNAYITGLTTVNLLTSRECSDPATYRPGSIYMVGSTGKIVCVNASDNPTYGVQSVNTNIIRCGRVYNNNLNGIEVTNGTLYIYNTKFGDTQVTPTQTSRDIRGSGTIYYAGLDFTDSQAAQNIDSNITAIAVPMTLSAPSLSSPADSATGQATDLTLSWGSVANATSYVVMVAEDSGFDTVVYAEEVSGTSATAFGLNNGTTYYWKVYAINGTTSLSDWSTARSFTTTGAPSSEPGIPTLSSPTDTATDISITPTLSWNASTDASTYTVQVSTSNTFGSFVVNQSGLTGTTHQPTLDYDTTYYWRVKATNVVGDSDWSSVWSFTTASPGTLDAPTLDSPADNAEGVSTDPTLSWNSVSGATVYHLQVADNEDFTTPVFDDDTISGTSEAVSGLTNNQFYYWRVRAGSEWSAWSTVRRFWVESASSESAVDYTKEIDGSITATEPLGRGHANNSAYAVHDKLWVHYDDGTNIVYRTTDADGTGAVSAKATALSGVAGTDFSVCFDGTYFHYAYRSTNDIYYRRGAPQADGSISFDTAVQAWTDATFNAYSVVQPAIAVNGYGHPFILFAATDATNYKPILLSSTNTSGGWTSRTGFPKDFLAQFANFTHGRSPILVPIGNNILGACYDRANFTGAARLWTADGESSEGTLGSNESPGLLDSDQQSSSLLLLSDGKVVRHTRTSASIRAINGSWGAVASWTSLWASDYGALMRYGSNYRAIARSTSTTSTISRTDSTDGDTWSSLTNHITGLTSPDKVVASQPYNTEGDYYCIGWRAGADSPYSFSVDIEGIVGGAATAPAKVSLSTPTNTETDVAQLTSFGWVATDATNHYQLQVALDSGFTNVVRDIAYILTNSHQLSSELVENTTHYWRVRAINEVGNGEWSDTRSFTTIADTPEDQANLNRIVTWGTTTSPSPVGNSINRSCEWLVGLRSWVFYTNGTDLVCRNKQIADGGAISNEIVVQAGITLGGRFDICLHNGYFHLIYISSNDLKYRRLTPNNDGTLTVGTERTAYTDVTWGVTLNYQSIEVDQLGNIFAQFVVTDGTNYKPIVTANDSGLDTWTTKPGFPLDLQTSSTSSVHGQSSIATFLADDVIAFVWRDAINSRLSCAIWNNGVLGSIVDTGLTVTTSWRVSAVALDGYLFINSGPAVARRTPAGVWSIVSPSGLIEWNYIHLSATDEKVRLTSRNDTDVRFVDTANYGDYWSAPRDWSSFTGLTNISGVVGGRPRNSRSDSHGVRDYFTAFIRTGAASPYSVVSAIDEVGFVISPSLLSPPSDGEGVPAQVEFVWDGHGDGRFFQLQVATDAEYNTLVVDEEKIFGNSYVAELDYSTQYYARLRTGSLE
jgi:hypothetical protein